MKKIPAHKYFERIVRSKATGYTLDILLNSHIYQLDDCYHIYIDPRFDNMVSKERLDKARELLALSGPIVFKRAKEELSDTPMEYSVSSARQLKKEQYQAFQDDPVAKDIMETFNGKVIGFDLT